VRCPKCLNIQGSTYPIKTTRCRRCSKNIDLEKIRPIGIYDDHCTMQEHLMQMKWDRKIPLEELRESMEELGRPLTVSSPKGRDRLRRAILDGIEGTVSVEDLVASFLSIGYTREEVESCIEELIRQGLLYSPKLGLISKLE
jgi:hypothetical protein